MHGTHSDNALLPDVCKPDALDAHSRWNYASCVKQHQTIHGKLVAGKVLIRNCSIQQLTMGRVVLLSAFSSYARSVVSCEHLYKLYCYNGMARQEGTCGSTINACLCEIGRNKRVIHLTLPFQEFGHLEEHAENIAEQSSVQWILFTYFHKTHLCSEQTGPDTCEGACEYTARA